MDNYIGKIEAEWVDPAVELPPDGWEGLIIWGHGDQRPARVSDGKFTMMGPNYWDYHPDDVKLWLRLCGPTEVSK